jgi:maleylpyruvate isomerase
MRAPLAADPEPEAVPALLDAVDTATRRLESAVVGLSDAELRAPSLLPGWSRAVVVTHLRHVAGASLRMVNEALAGQPTAFYPGGRAERQASLVVPDDEPLAPVVAELFERSAELSARWRTLSDDEWTTELREPRFGMMRLSRLVPLRWTEVEVHTVDLGLGVGGPAGALATSGSNGVNGTDAAAAGGHGRLDQWSDDFVRLGLPLRIAWLPNHSRTMPTADLSVSGRWLLQGDGAAWLVSTAGSLASASQLPSADEVGAVDCVIAGPDRTLLGFILGRVPIESLTVTGDVSLAHKFTRAFPGP